MEATRKTWTLRDLGTGKLFREQCTGLDGAVAAFDLSAATLTPVGKAGRRWRVSLDGIDYYLWWVL